MRLRKLAKDPGSGPQGCQTVYATEGRDLVIQGPVVDGSTFAELENVLNGEGAIVIKQEIVEEAIRVLRENGSS